MTKITLFMCLLAPILALQTELTSGEKWGYGLLTSFSLGMLGFVAAIILVLLGKWINSEAFKGCIKFFFSLACGTLLGDAIIHILSESYDDDSLNNYIVSLILILSLLGFLIIEKIFIKCGIVHEHWVQDQHSCHNNKQSLIQSSDITNDKKQLSNDGQNDLLINKKKRNCLQSFKGKGSAGYLNLIGSTIHNTIDGLSIGLAFSTGDSSVYVPMVIAIFMHEIPRQLGDVAILLKSRFSGWQTICSNGCINLLAVVGAVIGLSTSELSDVAQDYIMVFVAGNFIYIASDIWKHLFNDNWKYNILQFIGFGLGVGAMFGVKLLQHDD